VPLPAFVGPVVTGIIGIFKRRSERKNRIAEAKVEGEIERLKNTSDQSGWKDEYLVVLWTVPAIMAFIPPMQPYMERGFHILQNNTPDWYVIGLLGITGAVFGLKRLIDYKSK
jgi:hypothetical protein